MIKKTLIVFLMAVLLLAGCSQEGKASVDEKGSGEEQRTSLLKEGQTFVAEWGVSLGSMPLMPGQYSLLENELYYVSYDYDQEGGGVSCSHIFKKRPEQEPEEFYSLEKEYISLLFADRQGAVYSISSAEEEVPHVRKWKPDGTPEYDVEVFLEGIPEADQMPAGVGNLEEEFLSCKDCEVSPDGTLCLADQYGNLFLLDSTGQLTGVIGREETDTAGADAYGLVNAGKNGIFFYVRQEGGILIRAINLSESSLGQAVEVVMVASPMAVYSGYDEGILIQDASSLWLYGIAGQKTEKLLTWDDEYIVIQADAIEEISLTEENEIALLVQDQYLQAPRQVKLVKKEISELPEIQTVTVGVIVSNAGNYDTEWYQKTAREFHRSYPAYRLEVKTYDTNGMDLETDLLKREGPDLIELAYLDTEMLANQGVLEDLTPFLERGRVKKEDVLPSVIEAGTVNGKLVRLIESMSIQGMVTDSGIAEEGGWTPEEFLGMIEANPDIPFNWSADKSNLLSIVLCMDMDEYVDWEKQECYFQDERFINLLERIASMDFGDSLQFTPFLAVPFRNHEVLTAEVSIGRLDSYLEMKEAFGEETDFVGYPNGEGDPRYRIVTSYAFGMNSASSKKDGAWAFLELLLSEEYQTNFVNTGFPVREDVLEKRFQEPLYSGITQRMNPYDGLIYDSDLGEPAEKDLDFIRNVIDHARFGGNGAETVYRIIAEEAGGCFAGNKDAAEVAKVIQSRVSVYLNE